MPSKITLEDLAAMMQKEFEGVDAGFARLKNQLDSVERRLSERIRKIENIMGSTEEELREIKRELGSHRKHFILVDARLDHLEATV